MADFNFFFGCCSLNFTYSVQALWLHVSLTIGITKSLNSLNMPQFTIFINQVIQHDSQIRGGIVYMFIIIVL